MRIDTDRTHAAPDPALGGALERPAALGERTPRVAPEGNVPAGGTEAQATDLVISPAELDRIVELANALARIGNFAIRFRRSEQVDEMILEVFNRETGEVVRKIPPEELIARLREFTGFEGLLATREG
jgi:flagellar protein FlaG